MAWSITAFNQLSFDPNGDKVRANESVLFPQILAFSSGEILLVHAVVRGNTGTKSADGWEDLSYTFLDAKDLQFLSDSTIISAPYHQAPFALVNQSGKAFLGYSSQPQGYHGDEWGLFIDSQGARSTPAPLMDLWGGADWFGALGQFTDGSMVLTWSSERNGAYDIVAQNLDDQGKRVGNTYLIAGGSGAQITADETIVSVPNSTLYVVPYTDFGGGQWGQNAKSMIVLLVDKAKNSVVDTAEFSSLGGEIAKSILWSSAGIGVVVYDNGTALKVQTFSVRDQTLQLGAHFDLWEKPSPQAHVDVSLVEIDDGRIFAAIGSTHGLQRDLVGLSFDPVGGLLTTPPQTISSGQTPAIALTNLNYGGYTDVLYFEEDIYIAWIDLLDDAVEIYRLGDQNTEPPPVTEGTGIVKTNIGGGAPEFSGDAHGFSVHALSNGKIVVTGNAYRYSTNRDYALARYNSDGTLDNSFGNGGFVVSDAGGADWGLSSVIQPDGKILMAGWSSMSTALLRYNSNGTLDESFGSKGLVRTDLSADYDVAAAVALQTDGKILVAGSTYSGEPRQTDFMLIRYGADGKLDTTFGQGGFAVTVFGPGDDNAGSIAVQDDGKIVLAGHTWNGLDWDFGLVRHLDNGSLDTSFGAGGKVLTDLGGSDLAHDVLVLADGKILVSGDSDGSFTLVRYHANGSIDTTFGVAGVAKSLSVSGSARGLALQADGKILVGGSIWSPSGDTDFGVTRFNGNGSIDTSFGTAGYVRTPIAIGTVSDVAEGLSIQEDGKILVTGNSQGAFVTVRYNANGTLDTTFSIQGPVEDNSAPILLQASPAEGARDVALEASAVLTFNEAITRGTGTIIVRGASTGGLIEHPLDMATSQRLSVTGASLRIDLDNLLSHNTLYTVSLPAGALQDLAGNATDGVLEYSFTTAQEALTEPTYSRVLEDRVWYWEGGVPLSFEVVRIDDPPSQDKVWFFSKNALPTGQVSGVGVAITHDAQMIAKTSRGESSSETHESSGVLINREVWSNFVDWLPKTLTDQVVSQSFIPAGTPLTLNGKLLDTGSGPPFTSLSEMVRSLETFLNEEIDGDGIVGFLSQASVHGHAYHWKSHALLGAVEVEAKPSGGVGGVGALFELRGGKVDAAGDLTGELWVNLGALRVENLDVTMGFGAAAKVGFVAESGVSGWSLISNVVPAAGLNALTVAGFANSQATALTGSVKLGSLSVDYPAGQSALDIAFLSGLAGEQELTAYSVRYGAHVDATGTDGVYTIGSLSAGSYLLDASKALGSGETGSVINSADALAALKIAVGRNPNSDNSVVSPYQFLSADVNGSGSVNSADALAILKMAVKRSDAPAREWIFVDEKQDFWNEATSTFTTTRTSVPKPADLAITVDLAIRGEVNLVGMLKGDVNGSWGAPPGSETLPLGYFQALVTANQTFIEIGQFG